MKAKHYGVVAVLLIVAAIGGGVSAAWLVLTQSGYAQQIAAPAPRSYTPPGEPYSRSPFASSPAGLASQPAGSIVTARVIQFTDENGKIRCSLGLAPTASQQQEPQLLLTDENGKVLFILSGHAKVFPAIR